MYLPEILGSMCSVEQLKVFDRDVGAVLVDSIALLPVISWDHVEKWNKDKEILGHIDHVQITYLHLIIPQLRNQRGLLQ